MRMPTLCPHSTQQWACMRHAKLATDCHQYQKPPLLCPVLCKNNTVAVLLPDCDEDGYILIGATHLILVQSSPSAQFPAFHVFTKLGTLPNTVTPASYKIFWRNALLSIKGLQHITLKKNDFSSMSSVFFKDYNSASRFEIGWLFSRGMLELSTNKCEVRCVHATCKVTNGT